MSYIVLCKNGIELIGADQKVIASAPKSGKAYPIGEILKGQTVPGNMIEDFTRNYRPVMAIMKPMTTCIASPNASSRKGSDIDMIVLHHTVGTAASAIATFQRYDPINGASAHYIIAKDGTIFQMVEDQYKAWHAGNDNPNSIGIEHEAFDGDKLTAAQEKASIALCKWLRKEYNIPKANVTGHRFSPKCTTGTACPGALFGARTEEALRAWVDKNL